jgi:hypothetical protein
MMCLQTEQADYGDGLAISMKALYSLVKRYYGHAFAALAAPFAPLFKPYHTSPQRRGTRD